jgi:hypothetical protein
VEDDRSEAAQKMQELWEVLTGRKILSKNDQEAEWSSLPHD